MMNLTSKTSKSLLLFKRALVLLCFVLCSLMANAGGSSWKANYQVNVNGSTISTGQGTIYLSANVLVNDQQGSDVDDSKGVMSKSITSVTATYTGSLTLDYEQKVAGSGRNYYRTKTNYKNITLKAEAAPGSKFVKWANDDASTNPRVIKELAEFSCTNEGKTPDTQTHSTTFIPIFTAKTYYYKELGAEANGSGKVYISTTAEPPANSNDWQKNIAVGTTTLSQTADDNGKYARATIGTYYYHAKADDNYEFLGWYDKNGSKLSENEDFGYNLVATSENENSPTTVFLTAIFAPKSKDKIYPADVTNTGLSTGTEPDEEDDEKYKGFPYRKKTPIDLTKTFDAYGNALFDKLYIFGVTTSVDGEEKINLPSDILPCNAKTLCYVYKRSQNEDYYEYETMFDAVSTRFDHGESMNGQHLYFTGYCPFAYMGTKSTEEGWMYFKGGNATVDIYLDNCEIMGRYKTPTGKNDKYNEYILRLKADLESIINEDYENISFMHGSSSPFVFTSTTKNSGESYKPTIHIAGRNHLKGQLGSYITKTLGDVMSGDEVLTTMDAGIGNIYTYSAPITVKPEDVGTYTDLTLTDIWKDNTITNGYLHLDSDKGVNPSEKVVAIDLGSANGSLTINGGQYHLRNSAADGTYACNLAVGYRKFTKTVTRTIDIIISYDINVTLQLYGFGGDMTDSKVVINSGTFTMYPNMYQNGVDKETGDPIYLGTNYYIDQENFLDLRLPAGTNDRPSSINGGTFNGISNVLMCTQVTSTGASPKNAKGNWLCLHDVEIASEDNGVVTDFALSYPFDGVYNIPPCYDLTDTDNNKITGSRQYGAQSLNFYEKNIDGDSEKEKVVSLLLYPGKGCEMGNCCSGCVYQEEAVLFQWATALPTFDLTAKVDGKDEVVHLGEPISVAEAPEGETAIYQTNNLLYVDCQGLEENSININGVEVTFNDKEQPRGQVQNEKDYKIQKNLNILKVVQADTWYTFTAPYNVHQISVIETNESSISDKERGAAMEQQAGENMQIFNALQYFIIPNEQGRASSLTLESLLGTKRQTLVHYDGTNVMKANYYLYELDPDSLNTEGEFGTDATGTSLNIDWTPVKRNPGDPIMYQGETYAMQFPFCPMCNDDLNSRTEYDYWSNKMILFYGKGPQKIRGSSYQQSTILKTTPAKGYATLVGNSTLADMTAPSGAYVHQYVDIDPNDGDPKKQDWFIQPTPGYTVKPTEGYLLYTPVAGAQMPARISRSGQIEYDENVETGLPTIAGRTSLMLFGAYDGFEVLSLSEQLVTVYNLQGNIIFQQYMAEGQQVYVATGAGVFIVRGESETIKVMVE